MKPNSSPLNMDNPMMNENSDNSSPLSKRKRISNGVPKVILTRTQQARQRLGISDEDSQNAPEITEQILKGVGSRAAMLSALRGDDSVDARAFIKAYESISASDREKLRIEDFVIASGLSTRRFIECLTGALLQQASDITRMLVAVNQPLVVSATIKAATEQTPILDGNGDIVGHTWGDMKAQDMFHRATGFLPTPKGAQTTINLQQLNATNTPAALTEGDESCTPPPSMDAYLREIHDEVVRPKELKAAQGVESVPTIHPIGAPEIEYLDMEED